MSWYVSQDGEQLWIARDETVYTLVESDEKKLPVEDLTYLTVSSRRTIYHEHVVDEDILADGKSRVPRRKRDGKNGGKQRGFILRQEVEEEKMTRVVPCFKAAAQKLVEDGEVSRVDADDAVNTKRKKNKEERRVNLNLGVNECRVETTARINHFAHGAGFRVQVAQGSVTQRIHIFTDRRQMPFQEWHELLTEALESTGSYVMLARRTNSEANAAKEGEEQDEEQDGLLKVATSNRDKALQEDEEWLQRMMGMAEKDSEDGSDAESDEKSVEDARRPGSRSASVPPAPAPATARQAARSASPLSRTPHARQPPAPALPSRDRQPEEPTRSSKPRNNLRKGGGGSDMRDWRHVRDPPPHVGYTTDWKGQEEPPAQEVREPRDRRRGNDPNRWRERSRERPAREEAEEDDWRARGANDAGVANDRSSWREKSRERTRIEEGRPRGPSRRNAPGFSRRTPNVGGGEVYQGGQRGPSDPDFDFPWKHLRVPAAPRGRQQPVAVGQTRRPQPPPPPPAPWGQAQAAVERAKAPHEEENRTSKFVRDQAAKCAECNRGKPLKLFIDDDDGNPYCKACWVEFYGRNPPNK